MLYELYAQKIYTFKKLDLIKYNRNNKKIIIKHSFTPRNTNIVANIQEILDTNYDTIAVAYILLLATHLQLAYSVRYMHLKLYLE